MSPASVRPPAIAIIAGVSIAASSLILAAVDGPRYLSLSQLNFWLVPFSAGLFTALFAVPFLAHRTLFKDNPSPDRRWELAVLVWGGCALVVGALGFALGATGGFGSDSLAGSAGLIVVVEAGLILGAVLTQALAG